MVWLPIILFANLIDNSVKYTQKGSIKILVGNICR